jgi:hypothetical protein
MCAGRLGRQFPFFIDSSDNEIASKMTRAETRTGKAAEAVAPSASPEMDVDEEAGNPDWVKETAFDAELFDFLATAFPRAVRKVSEPTPTGR